MSNHSLVCFGSAAMLVSLLAGTSLAGPFHAGTNDEPVSISISSTDSLAGYEPGVGMQSRSALDAVPSFHPTQILVRLDPFSDRSANDQQLREAGVQRTLRAIRLVPGLHVMSVEAGTVEETCARLNQQAGVMYATPDYVRHATAQSVPYGISLVKANTAWGKYGKGDGAKVAVLDTGIDAAHPDLPAPMLMQSFVPGTPVDDFNEHGTHCSGTVLGLDNTIGVVGVAPRATLMIGKVLNNGGYGLDSWIADGIGWAVANGADVISMSLGGDEVDQGLQDACLAAYNAGVLVVAAAGNDSSSLPHYPAAYPGVMSIAAVDSNSQLASFSNYGTTLSMSAPGVNVDSTIPLISTTVTFNNVARTAQNMSGSPGGSLAAKPAIYCGLGTTAADFPPTVAGNIAHIRRGSANFGVKALNAVNAGAVGVIISNNTGGNAQYSGNLEDSFLIPVVSISQNDGNTLQAASGTPASIAQANVGHSYDSFNGTSMACPHVAGGAGLLIGMFKAIPQPNALPPGSLRWILEQNATDLGATGKDDLYGWGLMNVNAAAQYLHGRAICRGDLAPDGFVDDSDFVAFVHYYDEYVSPGGAWTGGDLNGDGVCDDSDFVMFAQSYDQFLCPE